MFIVLINTVDFVLKISFVLFTVIVIEKYIDFLDISTSKRNITHTFTFVKR